MQVAAHEGTHPLYTVAEIAVTAFCAGAGDDVLKKCDDVFRHLGWFGRSELSSIIAVAADSIGAFDGCLLFPNDLDAPVRALIARLVTEVEEAEREESQRALERAVEEVVA
jgi:hypothetical protein